MKEKMFFTGAFEVLPDGGLNVVHKTHSVPGELYDDDVLSWIISKDDMEMFSDGYVSNKDDCITIHIRSECHTDKTISRVKEFFLHEEKEIGLNIQLACFRGWNIEKFIYGINKGPFHFLKDAKSTMTDSEIIVRQQRNKDIFRCAVDQAWLDMCRTLQGGKSKKQKWEECKKRMAESLKYYFEGKPKKSIAAFDGWHDSTTSGFRDYGKLTVGQTQKILNMAMKYLYCCDDIRRKVKDHFKYSHIPLDGYILNWYKTKVNKKYDKKPWSKIDNLNEYHEIIRKVRGFLGEENLLESEFVIWREEKEKEDVKALNSCANKIIQSDKCSQELKELLLRFRNELESWPIESAVQSIE